MRSNPNIDSCFHHDVEQYVVGHLIRRELKPSVEKQTGQMKEHHIF
jgi:hypothetical protein